MNLEGNLRLMKTLDDAWNSQDWDTFIERHAESTEVLARTTTTYQGKRQP